MGKSKWTKRDRMDKELLKEHFERSVPTPNTVEKRSKKVLYKVKGKSTFQKPTDGNFVAFCPECEAAMTPRRTMHPDTEGLEIGMRIISYYRCGICRKDKQHIFSNGFNKKLSIIDHGDRYECNLYKVDKRILPEILKFIQNHRKVFVCCLPDLTITVTFNSRSSRYHVQISKLPDVAFDVPITIFRDFLKKLSAGLSLNLCMSKLDLGNCANALFYAVAIFRKAGFEDRIVVKDQKTVTVVGKVYTYHINLSGKILTDSKSKIVLDRCVMPSSAVLGKIINLKDLSGECVDYLKILYLLVNDEESADRDFAFGNQIYGESIN